MRYYYYDDSLAVVWMTTHFGMKFVEPDRMGCGIATIVEHGVGKYVVHPDSLALLEPREGDIGADIEDGPIWFSAGIWVDRLGEFDGSARIIQRDGKAFHWPKQEA